MPNLQRLGARVICALLAFPATADTLSCEGGRFSVSSADSALAEHTCEVLKRARTMLAQCGVILDRPIDIHLRDRVEGAIGECFAIYHCGEDRIEVLTPSATRDMREAGSAFAPVSDSAYWESILVHELVHAAYDEVYCPFSSCIATSEYASYAMQVWSLPKDEQAVFGSTIELRSKPTRDAISAMMYYLSPSRFAVLSWQHFQARPDPCTYMQLIMDGQIYFDREPL